MKKLTFITGNASKAKYLEKYLDHPVDHVKVDLDEIQSMSLEEIVRHKAMGAYEIVKSPVLVEDVSLEFTGLGGLPGPFIKFFLDNMTLQDIADLVRDKTRDAVARCVMAYYDGEHIELFEGSIEGKVADGPSGDEGFGWDPIFIPDGYNTSRAELSEEDYKKSYTTIKRIDLVKEFLEKLS